jgi:hypothetical protein
MNENHAMLFHKWTRCGEYKIEQVKTDQGLRSYIRPVPDSGFIRYDIVATQRKKGSRKVEENTLVLSLLNMDTKSEESILNFVNRFGLLGLLTHNYLDPMFPPMGSKDDTELRLVPERNGVTMVHDWQVEEQYLFSYKGMAYKDLLQQVSEPLEEFKKAVIDFQEARDWIYAINRCTRGEGSSPLREKFKKDKYRKNYGEVASTATNSELIGKASMLVSFLLAGEFTNLTREIIPGDDQEPWVTRWGFDSLLSAAYFFLSEYMLSNFWIGKCPRCGKHYISSVKTQGYCSRKCDDAERKAKSRKAKAGAPSTEA